MRQLATDRRTQHQEYNQRKHDHERL